MGRHTNQMRRKLISERHFKAGYTVRKELWMYPGFHNTEMTMAYTLKGDWIGSPKLAKNLIVKRGIMPERASRNHLICSIGFCEKEQKWYGWSHRAGIGFGLGDKLFEKGFDWNKTDKDKISFNRHGKITIKNMEQAKQAAKNFARSVS